MIFICQIESLFSKVQSTIKMTLKNLEVIFLYKFILFYFFFLFFFFFFILFFFFVFFYIFYFIYLFFFFENLCWFISLGIVHSTIVEFFAVLKMVNRLPLRKFVWSSLFAQCAFALFQVFYLYFLKTCFCIKIYVMQY